MEQQQLIKNLLFSASVIGSNRASRRIFLDLILIGPLLSTLLLLPGYVVEVAAPSFIVGVFLGFSGAFIGLHLKARRDHRAEIRALAKILHEEVGLSVLAAKSCTPDATYWPTKELFPPEHTKR